MRIAVIGAGALGGTFAGLLAGAGHEVTVTARGQALSVIRSEGITSPADSATRTPGR